MKRINLNDIATPTDGAPVTRFRGSVVEQPDSVEIMFDALEASLARRVREADFVVGCMAWLTNRKVLSALAEIPGCQIVVQKEDFLRPGAVGREELRVMYSALRGTDRMFLPGAASGLSYCSDPTCAPVRCMGVAKRHPSETIPRMHHKFFVFCRKEERGEEPWQRLHPYAVWTGSFNATENATLSRENALFIESDKVAHRFLDEWVRVLALSEPLDWNSDYVEPEWRFGS